MTYEYKVGDKLLPDCGRMTIEEIVYMYKSPVDGRTYIITRDTSYEKTIIDDSELTRWIQRRPDQPATAGTPRLLYWVQPGDIVSKQGRKWLINGKVVNDV